MATSESHTVRSRLQIVRKLKLNPQVFLQAKHQIPSFSPKSHHSSVNIATISWNSQLPTTWHSKQSSQSPLKMNMSNYRKEWTLSTTLKEMMLINTAFPLILNNKLKSLSMFLEVLLKLKLHSCLLKNFSDLIVWLTQTVQILIMLSFPLRKL
jgi:hypothetical protein